MEVAIVLSTILFVILTVFTVTKASIPNPVYINERGYQPQEESRSHQDKGDIIDLDDANFDTPDLKIDKIRKPKTHALILDQDSDETDIGPSDDLFDNIDEYQNAPVFKLASTEIKLDDSRTVIQAVTDDEDVSQGSGSGDTEIEIEEDPDVFNTTDVADETEYTYDNIKADNGDQDTVDSIRLLVPDYESSTQNLSDEARPLASNLPPFCEEVSNITWAPWSPWIRTGDVDVRFRRCPADKGYSSNANHCQGEYIQTRHCDQHDVKMCRTSTGYLTEEHHVSCEGIDLDDVKHIDELRNIGDNQDSCEYTLYDLKYNMPIGPTLNTDSLVEADSNMWCEQGDKYIPFYTPTERCLNKLKSFCKSEQNCKYEKRRRKDLKNKGDLKKDCWKHFVLGGVLPKGIAVDGSRKLLCQRFSKDSAFGKVLGYKEDHYATVYDTTRRMPVVTMATVQSLADEKWPAAPLMIEQGLVREGSNVISWFYKDRRRGMCTIEDLADPCQTDTCKLGERQAIPSDFDLSGYRIAPLISPDIIGGTLSKRLSTNTLTNAAPMEPTVFARWKKVMQSVRRFEREECRIPVIHYNDNKEVHTSKYGHELPEVYLLSGTYASERHFETIGNDVTVPEMFWLAVCCAHGADVASFGVYVNNNYQAQPKLVSILNLQKILIGYFELNQTDINLYPAFDSICSAEENDVSFKIYL